MQQLCEMVSAIADDGLINIEYLWPGEPMVRLWSLGEGFFVTNSNNNQWFLSFPQSVFNEHCSFFAFTKACFRLYVTALMLHHLHTNSVISTSEIQCHDWFNMHVQEISRDCPKVSFCLSVLLWSEAPNWGYQAWNWLAIGFYYYAQHRSHPISISRSFFVAFNTIFLFTFA